MAYGGQNPGGHGFLPEYTSQFQSFEFYNSQQQPDGRPPWLQQWDYDNSRVQRANNYPRHGQRQFRQNPRQPAQQPRQDRRQPLLDNPQPQQQQQRQDRRQPLLENPQPQPESSTQNWPNLSNDGSKKKRNRPPKKSGGESSGFGRPGPRWSREGDRRSHNPRNTPMQTSAEIESVEQNAYFCPPKREIKPINTGSKKMDPQFKSQREFLAYNMSLEKLECMVCMDVIRHKNPVWSCANCYNIFHIWCIQKWSQSAEEDGWRCPGCQGQYFEPPEKSCFCGKTRQQAQEMKLKSYSSKHCCEEVCFKKRTASCEHCCSELCHPGPCPPCEGMSLRKCPCGKKAARVKCNVESDLLCDNQCEKLLSCGRHPCPLQCHTGSCQPCEAFVELECMCGRKKESVPCKEAPKGDLSNYSCHSVCKKPLLCGHHSCADECHFGSCKPCPLLPEVNKNCLCGKVAQQALLLAPRKSCLDPVPQCPNKCSKTLPCEHSCPEKCHSGSCPPCTLQSQTFCACGSSKKMVPCAIRAFDPITCNKKCQKWLSCLRHKCHEVCCRRETHDCLQVCNKFLNCGRHKCDQLCHSGRCAPCLLASFDELRCECGTEVMYPPIQCGTRPPPCQRPCPRPHPCGHNNHHCHSEQECPPCTVPVKKWCMGNHKEVYPVLCNQEFVSCHLLCSKPLECGEHSCVKKCHAGVCLDEKCSQPCSKQRTDCGHSCNVPCHASGPCPETKCLFELKVTCECKTVVESRPCYQQLEAYKKKVALESMWEAAQGRLVSGAAPLAHWTSVVGLECGPECSVKQRLDRAFVALQIVNPDLGQKLKLDYPVALQNWVAQDKEFVKEVHATLADLVFKTQEGRQRFRTHSFGIMNQIKRKFVHEYATFFGLTSQSMDKKHSRSVDVTAEKNNCWLPSISLHEMVEKKLTHSSSKWLAPELKQMTKRDEPLATASVPLASSSSSTVLSYTQALAAKKN